MKVFEQVRALMRQRRLEKQQLQQIEQSVLFDAKWYQTQYGVPAAQAARHYLTKGWLAGCDPSVHFCTRYYQECYNQIPADVCPLVYFLENKQQQTDFCTPKQLEDYRYLYQPENQIFNWEQYAAWYVPKGDQVDAICYYVRQGYWRGDVLNPLFDEKRYAEAHMQDADSQEIPLVHYLKNAGQTGRPPLSGGVSVPQAVDRKDGQWLMVPAERARQDREIAAHYRKNEPSLIVFLVPDYHFISGGVRSIVNIAQETVQMEELHHSKVLLMTLPSRMTFSEYFCFSCDSVIYRFEQLARYFKPPQRLLLHIPETYVQTWLDRIDDSFLQWLGQADFVHINVMNQNILMMPPQRAIDRLSELADLVTQTIGHEKYCTLEIREKYGIPGHLLIAHAEVKYHRCGYRRKENLLVYSPDERPQKKEILEQLRRAFPQMRQVEVNGISFEEYIDLVGRAKWVITFGEGLDNYFAAPLNSGGVSFAVYNEEFFTPEYKDLHNLFSSFEEMRDKIADRIKAFDTAEQYAQVSSEAEAVLNRQYDVKRHLEQLREFYLGQYTFP